MSQRPYPKPKEVGGTLIREVIAALKQNGVQLPLSSHILIAVSGGADSLAMGHLLATYGRRVVPVQNISFLHFNHGWRGKKSDADAAFVRSCAKKWGVSCITISPPRKKLKAGESVENAARIWRKKTYRDLCEKHRAVVFTAHQADDVAETLLWRLFTGAAATHGVGILFQDGVEIRPLRNVRKSMLRAYLKEERLKWREDQTNHEGRFLRSKMRLKILPEIEAIFPKAVSHLLKAAQNSNAAASSRHTVAEILFQATGQRLRRSQIESLEALLADSDNRQNSKELHLPGGWRLSGPGKLTN